MPGERAVGEGWSDGLLESGFGSRRAAALVSWDARIGRMLEVEAALARAQARLGLIPGSAAEAIAAACRDERLDLDGLAEVAATAATPVIPLLRMVRDSAGPEVAAYLHHGATSQDVIDTAFVLTLRGVLELVEGELLAIGARCADLADRHRGTLMAGRTLAQHTAPITFGLLAARWLGVVDRRLEHLRLVRPRVEVVQLGGLVGTLGVYGDHGPDLVAAVADELELAAPDLPWHAERDRIVELSGMLAGIADAAGGVAGALMQLARTEVAEVRMVPGAGPSSSAAPHKRNPVDAMAARAAARAALGELRIDGLEHEHERAAGAWQVEWVTLPNALVRLVGALERLRAALDGLEVDADRARRNLELSLGLTGSEALASALVPALGRADAHAVASELAQRCLSEERSLADVAVEDERVVAAIGQDGVRDALDPTSSLRSVDALVDAALATHRALAG